MKNTTILHSFRAENAPSLVGGILITFYALLVFVLPEVLVAQGQILSHWANWAQWFLSSLCAFGIVSLALFAKDNDLHVAHASTERAFLITVGFMLFAPAVLIAKGYFQLQGMFSIGIDLLGFGLCLLLLIIKVAYIESTGLVDKIPYAFWAFLFFVFLRALYVSPDVFSWIPIASALTFLFLFFKIKMYPSQPGVLITLFMLIVFRAIGGFLAQEAFR